jgi:hypothetical protein
MTANTYKTTSPWVFYSPHTSSRREVVEWIRAIVHGQYTMSISEEEVFISDSREYRKLLHPLLILSLTSMQRCADRRSSWRQERTARE